MSAPTPAPPDNANTSGDLNEPPPILGSWRTLYLLLVVELIIITAGSALLSWWAT